LTVRAWLRRGATATLRAADRSDLWPAGALASLAFLGWVPLLLAVARIDIGDLTFLASSLRASSAFPANVIALAVAIVAGFMLLCLLAAAAEAALLRTASASESGRPPFSHAALAGFTVILACALPAAVATAGLLLGASALVPAEVQSPDFGVPLVLRLVGLLSPFLLALLLAVLLGQAIGGAALRPALAQGVPPAVALGRSLRELVRRPWGRAGVATAGLVGDLLAVALTYAVLRVLWAPIAAELDRGRLASPDTLLLLVGLVAIWLALVLAAGALHVGISTWWALELADPMVPDPAAAVARPADERGGSTDDARPLP
jgi:hypothetical protein